MSYVTEFCPECESEIEIRWDVKTDGYKAYCPVCGSRLMLCDECQHRVDDNQTCDCDYDSKTDSCRFNPNRIKMIEAKRAYLNKDAEEKAAAEIKLRQNLIDQIHQRCARIQDVLAIARALVDNKFILPYRRNGIAPLEKYGYPYGVMADGFDHGLGIWTDTCHSTYDLAILMGGACGRYDFHTDGYSIESYDPQTQASQPVPTRHLQMFINEFDKFEKAFYAWVDDTMSIK